MCTVVCRWQPGDQLPVQLLALRDELAGRSFDAPGEWWQEQPGVIGGRDRVAGGTWCASDIAGGVTAVVLNRPERRVAAPGAPSRGVLPLHALAAGRQWPERLTLTGMAAFNVVRAAPDSLDWWRFDGDRLESAELPAGTYLFKPTGLADQRDPRFATGADPVALDGPIESLWGHWLDALHEAVPSEDGSGLLVRRTIAPGRYETVFGQFIAARPGRLRVDYLNSPVEGTRRDWTTRVWTLPPA